MVYCEDWDKPALFVICQMRSPFSMAILKHFLHEAGELLRCDRVFQETSLKTSCSLQGLREIVLEAWSVLSKWKGCNPISIFATDKAIIHNCTIQKFNNTTNKSINDAALILVRQISSRTKNSSYYYRPWAEYIFTSTSTLVTDEY